MTPWLLVPALAAPRSFLELAVPAAPADLPALCARANCPLPGAADCEACAVACGAAEPCARVPFPTCTGYAPCEVLHPEPAAAPKVGPVPHDHNAAVAGVIRGLAPQARPAEQNPYEPPPLPTPPAIPSPDEVYGQTFFKADVLTKLTAYLSKLKQKLSQVDAENARRAQQLEEQKTADTVSAAEALVASEELEDSEKAALKQRLQEARANRTAEVDYQQKLVEQRKFGIGLKQFATAQFTALNRNDVAVFSKMIEKNTTELQRYRTAEMEELRAHELANASRWNDQLRAEMRSNVNATKAGLRDRNLRVQSAVIGWPSLVTGLATRPIPPEAEDEDALLNSTAVSLDGNSTEAGDSAEGESTGTASVSPAEPHW